MWKGALLCVSCLAVMARFSLDDSRSPSADKWANAASLQSQSTFAALVAEGLLTTQTHKFVTSVLHGHGVRAYHFSLTDSILDRGESPMHLVGHLKKELDDMRIGGHWNISTSTLF